MVDLPHEAQVDRTVTETFKLELTSDQLEVIIKAWAKGYGFSHRANIDFDWDHAGGAIITETVNRS